MEDIIKQKLDSTRDSINFFAKTATSPQEVTQNAANSFKDFLQYSDKSQLPQRSYTWKEIATFDGEDGRPLFIVYDKNVYDITEFASMHPAGPKPLKRYAGRDATMAMNNSGMQIASDLFQDLLKRCKVGSVNSTEAGSWEAPPDSDTKTAQGSAQCNTFNILFQNCGSSG